MSTTIKKKGYDPLPDIKSAGKVEIGTDETVFKSFQYDKNVRGETPPDLKKWRQTKKEPGKKCIHPGLANDYIDQDKRYGKQEVQIDFAKDALNVNTEVGIGIY